MAGPVNTTTTGTTGAPGAVPGAPPTEGIQRLEGEVAPGEDIPLPTGADGKQQTTGGGTVPAEGGFVQQTAPQGTTPGTTTTTRTQQPTSTPFNKDGLDTSRTTPSSPGETNATRPYGDYNIPEGDLKVEGQTTGETEGLHASVATAVTDIVKNLFADPSTITWAQDRAQYLTQNPSEGVLPQLADTDGAKALGNGLLQALDFSKIDGGLNAQFGEGTQQIVAASRQMAFDLVLGNGVLGGQLDFNKLATDFATRLENQGGNPLFEGGFGLTAADGTTPPTTLSPSTIFNPDGTPNLTAMNALGPAMLGMLEASLESMIGLAGHLLKGDVAKDIDMMSARLKELKEEKKVLMGKLLEKEGSVLGILMSSTDAVKRANEAQECANTWKMIGAIVACVVVIIVAIVVTVFSFGAAGPAAIAGAMAFVGFAAATCAALAVPLAIALAVAAITMAVVTLVQTIPVILQALAALFRALGMPEVAENLETWAADYQQFMKDSGLGTALTVIAVVASVVMAVIMLPMAAASLAASSATVMASLSSAAAAGATTASSLAGPMLQTIGLIGLVGGVLSGACNVVGAVYMKQFAKLQYEMELLRAKLAEVELEIKTIMHEISKKKTEEEDVKDDIAGRQEMEGRVMENLNKCAESLKTLLNAASIMG